MAVAKIREEIHIKLNADGVYLVGGTRVTLDTVIRAHKTRCDGGKDCQTISRVKSGGYLFCGWLLFEQSDSGRTLSRETRATCQAGSQVERSTFQPKGHTHAFVCTHP